MIDSFTVLLCGIVLLLVLLGFVVGFLVHSLWICNKCDVDSDAEIIRRITDG